MKIRAQAGAKVFFFGEYAALLGGPAGLISFSPNYQFEVEFQNRDQFIVEGVHADSPSAKYLKQQCERGEIPPGLYSFSAASKNPKGFGSSTVEYLAALAIEKELLTKRLMTKTVNNNVSNTIDKVEGTATNDTGVTANFSVQGWKSRIPIVFEDQTLKIYRELAQAGKTLPSGYDLLAQEAGGIQAILSGQIDSAKSIELQKMLSNYQIGIFHTGRKLATHEAIRELNSASLAMVNAASEKCWNAIGDEKNFWFEIKAFTEQLQAAGWTQKESIDLLATIRQDSRVLFAKACGAMGADSIVIVSKEKIAFQDFEKLGLKFVGSTQELAAKFFYERLA